MVVIEYKTMHVVPELSIVTQEVLNKLNDCHINDEDIINLLAEKSISVLGFLDYLMLQFIHVNFIGGASGEAPLVTTGLDVMAVEALTCEGEKPFCQGKNVGLLWLCKRLSNYMCKLTKTFLFSYLLLSLKCIYLHQYLLGLNRSSSIATEFDELRAELDAVISESDSIDQKEIICYYMLVTYLSLFYYKYEVAEAYASKCSSHLQLTVNLSGALGKRTKFQQKDVANLFLQVDCPSNETDMKNQSICAVPKNVFLDDDTLLNNVAFSGDTPINPGILSITQQGFILLLSELYRLTHAAEELTYEQCLTYLNTVLFQAYPESEPGLGGIKRGNSCWPIVSEALFRRSLFERSSIRKMDRSMQQLEELANQFTRPEPSAPERSSENFFFSRMPSIWSIQLEQASMLMKVGCVKSALDIYIQLQQWFNIIDCYTCLNKREKAEELIRKQLDSGDHSPELYCALGDVTKDREHYFKAWEVSDHRSARAMRSLGVVFMYIDKDHTKAMEYFEKSLELNALQAQLWFTYGCCCLQAKNYPKAEKAFRRCVQIDPDNFEAWNNCASAVMLQGNKPVALKLLKEACKHDFENWRIWDNIAIVSIDVGSFRDCIQAYHRLLDMRPKHSDAQLLSLLTQAVMDDVPDITDEPASKLRDKLLELFERATTAVNSDASLWTDFARLLMDEKPKPTAINWQKAIQHLQSAHRCRVQHRQGAWELSADKRKAVVDGLQHLARVIFDVCEPEDLNHSDEVVSASGVSPDFIRSALASLRLSVIAANGHLKIAAGSCVVPETVEELTALRSELETLLSTVEDRIS